MLFENKYFLKLYRKLEDGVNPDVEITRFLTERRGFPHVPAFAGAIEYRRGKFEPTVVCLLQAAVPMKAMPGRSRSMRSAVITSGSWSGKRICRSNTRPPDRSWRN